MRIPLLSAKIVAAVPDRSQHHILSPLRVDTGCEALNRQSAVNGAAQYSEMMGGGYGFIKADDVPTTGLAEKVERTAVEAARRKFSPEFMNR